jgi:hypothetical protein
MKTYLAVILTIVIAGGVGVGGTYYFLNKKAATDRSNLQAQIDVLNTKLLGDTAQSSPTATTTATAPATSPETIVTSFYNWYNGTDADRSALASAPGGSQALQTWYDTAMNAQGTAGGADPIVCAQDTPPSITATTLAKDATSAQVNVTEAFTPSLAVTVNLKAVSGLWQIASVTCPSSN